MLSKPNAIIVDIDGTVSNYEHRRQWIPNPNNAPRTDIINPSVAKFWDRFHEEAINDKPIAEVISILKWMKNSCATNKILLVTGRMEKNRRLTNDWFTLHRIPSDRLFMRKDDDYRRDIDVKREIFDQHIRDKYNVLFALEDRDCVTELWRSMGIRCLQVAKGEY